MRLLGRVMRHSVYVGALSAFVFGFLSVVPAFPKAAAAATHTVSSVSPSTGSAAGGETITITGTNFVTGMNVRVDGVNASNIVVQNSTTITARTPVSSPGTVNVSVINASNEAIILHNAYTYTDTTALSLTSINPTSGPSAGGTNVMLSGAGYAGFVPFTAISASVNGDSMCGIAAGVAYCWGLNGSGRLGDGTTDNHLVPTKVLQEVGVLAGKTVTAISVGGTHACAIASGEVYCWGNNGSTQLGDGGTTNNRSKPYNVSQGVGALQGKTIVDISAGNTATCAVTSDGEAYCWGSNTAGQLGDNSTTPKSYPTRVAYNGVLNGKTITNISIGSTHTCAIASGEAYCWGNNTNGRLGNNSTTQSLVAVKVTQTSGLLLGKTVTSISAGTNHTCAVAGGEAYCWGANGTGRLGDNSTTQRLVPVKVTQTSGLLLGKTVTSITAGIAQTCAAASDGTGYCWGANNANGRLGDGTINNSSVPVQVSAGGGLFEKDIAYMAMGGEYSCALARQNMYCFGTNASGEFGNNTTTSSATASATSIQSGAVPLELTFGSTTGTITNQTSSQVTAVTPAGSGIKNVTLRRTDTNQNATLTNAFQYIGAPQISSVSHVSGPQAGGDRVTINGSNFVNGATVSFGSNAATAVTYVSDSRIDVTTPAAGTHGTVTVTLTNPDTQQAQLTNGYTYVPPQPTMTSVSPARGKMAGGNTVQITGTNFISSVNPSISFDGVAATSVTVTNSTTLTVGVPASTTVKKADITYTNSYNQSITLADAYTYLPQSYSFTNAPLVLSATEPGQMTVQARNPSSQPATIDDPVALTLSSSTTTGFFADSATGTWDKTVATIAAGSSSTSFYFKDTAKGTPVITVTDPGSTTATQSATIGSRTKFQVTGVSDPIAAGIPSSVTIRAITYDGQPETGYTGTVHFSSDDVAARLPQNFIMTSDMKGVHTFVNGVTFKTVGEHCLTVTDISEASTNGQQCNITTTAAPAGSVAKLKFINAPQSTASAKSSSAITVQTQDVNGAPAAVDADTSVYISSTSGTASFSLDGVNGWSSTKPYGITIPAGMTSATFYYKDSTLGSATLLAADLQADSTTTDNGLTNDTQSILVGVGNASKVVVGGNGSTMVNQQTSITVGLADDANNPVTVLEDTPVVIDITSGTAQLYATSGGSAQTLPYTATILAGSSTVTLYIIGSQVGSVEITASDPVSQQGITPGTKTITVNPATPFAVRFLATSAMTVHTSDAVQVQLYDEYGNVTPALTNMVINVGTSSQYGEFRATANGPAITSRSVAQGTSTITLYYYSSNIGTHTAQVSASGLVGDTEPLVIKAGAPNSLAFTATATPLVAGVSRQYTFEFRDQDGFATTVTQDTPVSMTSQTGGEFSIDGTTWGATSIPVLSGQSGGSFYYRNTLAGADSITIATAGNAMHASSLQNIIAAAPRELVFGSDPQVVAKDLASDAISITFKDIYGNQAIADASTKIALSDTSGTGQFATSANGPWSATPTVTVTPNALSQAVYYRSSTVGSWQIAAGTTNYQGASQSIEVISGFATKLRLTPSQTSFIAGEAQPVTLSTVSSQNDVVPVLANTTVTLNSTNQGQYSETLSPFTPITSTVIANRTSGKTLFYRAQTAGVATLSATSPGLTSANQTQPITPSSIYAFSVNPASQEVPINSSSSPYTTTAVDVFGNVSPVASDTPIYTYSDSGSGSFSQDAAINSGSATAQFTYRDSEFKQAPVAIMVSDKSSLDSPDADIQNGHTSATIVNSVPTAITFDTAPQSAIAGELSQVITVSLTTADGQPAYQDGTTSVNFASNQGGVFYESTSNNAPQVTSVSVARGEATVDVYYRGTLAAAHTITASYDSVQKTQQFTVNAAEAQTTAIVSSPQQVPAGTASNQFTAKFYDAYMNEATITQDITLDLSSSCVTGQFSQSANNWQAINDIELTVGTDQAVFYYKDTQAGLCTLTVSSDDLGSATQQVTIQGASAAQLQVTLTNSQLESGQQTSMAIRVVDIYGNVTPVSSSTPLYLRSSSSTANFSPSSATLLAGQSQTSVSYSDTTPGNAVITVADQAGTSEAFGSLTDASTAVTVTNGDPVAFGVATSPNGRVGEWQSVTITILNDYDDEIPATNPVQVSLQSDAGGSFSASEGGVSIGDVTVPAGESRVTVYYRQTVSGVATVSFADVADVLEPKSTQITFSAVDVSSMRILGDTDTDLVTGQYKSRIVQFYDQYGNVSVLDAPLRVYARTSSGTGAFFAQSGNSSAMQYIDAQPGTSQVTVYYRDTMPGNATLTVSDDLSGTDTGIANDTQQVTINYGDPSSLRISQSDFTVVRGEVYGPLTIEVLNAAGTVIPSPEDATISLSATGGGEFATSSNALWASTPQRSLLSGQTSITSYFRNKTGVTNTPYVITVGATIAGHSVNGSASYRVTYGTASHLAIATPAQTITANHPSAAITVQLRNTYGSAIAASQEQRVYLRSSQPTGEFSPSTNGPWAVNYVTIPAGADTVTAYYRSNQPGVHKLTAADNLPLVPDVGLLNATQDMTITQQVIDHFYVANISDPQKAGTPSSVVVVAQDDANFTVADYAGTIHFSSDDSTAVLPEDFTFDPTADKGSKTFTNSVAFRTAGEKIVTVTDDNTVSGSQSDITVTPPNANPVNSVSFTNPTEPYELPVSSVSDAIMIQALDASGEPTVGAGIALPVQLSSSSASGQFALSPTGPWQNQLTLTIPAGITWVNAYYRDTVPATTTLTARDWIANTDNASIQNDDLEVLVRDHEISSETTLYSQSAVGGERTSRYLFAHNEAGDVAGRSTHALSSTHIPGGDAYTSDWDITFTQGSRTLDAFSVNQVSTVPYELGPLMIKNSAESYNLAAESRSLTHATKSLSTVIQTSGWVVRSEASWSNGSPVALQATTGQVGNTVALATVEFAVYRADAMNEPVHTIRARATESGRIVQNITAGDLGSGNYYLLTRLLDVNDNILAEDMSPAFAIGDDKTIPVIPGVTVTPDDDASSAVVVPGGGTAQLPDRGSSVSRPPATPTEDVVSKTLRAIAQSPYTPIVAPLLFVIGLLVFVAFVALQIIRQVQYAAALQKILDRDARTSRDKQQFMNLIAHHLRTPVTIITGAVELLSSLPQTKEAAALVAQRTATLSEVANKLVSSINERVHSEAALGRHMPDVIRVYRLPSFWISAVIGLVVVVGVNIFVTQLGGQSVGWTTQATQLLLVACGLALLYAVMQERSNRRRLAQFTRQELHHRDQLDDAKNHAIVAIAQQLDEVLIECEIAAAQLIQSAAPGTNQLHNGLQKLRHIVSTMRTIADIHSAQVTAQQTTLGATLAAGIGEEQDLLNGKRLDMSDDVRNIALQTDPALLTTVFASLLDNAAAFSPENGKIQISATETDASVAITITDEGPGVPEEIRQGLNEPFTHPGDEMSETHQGLGLSLFLDALIMRHLSGSITIRNREQGAVVELILPKA